MLALHAAPTGAIPPTLLGDIRGLLDAAFPDDFSDDDWRHAMDGVHVWLAGPDGLVSHASLVERTLVCSGTTMHVGYVEAVATLASRRRQGHGARVMRRIGELIGERHALAAPSTGTPEYYETLGWERWRGQTFVASPDGLQRTPDDDGDILILRTTRTPHLDLDGPIVCDWRSGDVW